MLILIVDILECVEATSGAAVADVLTDVEVERVTNVVVLGGAGAELTGLVEERDKDEEGDDDDAAEVVVTDVMAKELTGEDEEAGVLAAGWLFILLGGAELAIEDCIDIEGGGGGVPLDDPFPLGRNAGLKAIENAFAGQAQAQLQA